MRNFCVAPSVLETNSEWPTSEYWLVNRTQFSPK